MNSEEKSFVTTLSYLGQSGKHYRKSLQNSVM